MLRARARERKPENEAVLDERDEGTKGLTVQRRGTEGLQVVHRERYEDKRGRKACTRRGETALSTSLLHRRRSHRRHLHRRSHHRRLLLLHIPLHQSYRHRTRRRRRRTLPSYRIRRSLPLHTLLRCKGDPVARQHDSRDVREAGTEEVNAPGSTSTARCAALRRGVVAVGRRAAGGRRRVAHRPASERDEQHQYMHEGPARVGREEREARTRSRAGREARARGRRTHARRRASRTPAAPRPFSLPAHAP